MLAEVLNIGIGHYLFVSGALFIIGLLGVLLRKNIIVILMSIELMLNGVNLAFVTFGHYLNDPNGAIIVLFIMAIAAAEAAARLRDRRALEPAGRAAAVAAAHRVLAVAVTAAEAVGRPAALGSVAVGGTAHTVLTVAGFADSVAAGGS